MIDEHLLGLIRKYGRKGILIDTNLALLYIVGSLDPLGIRSHPRTANYTTDDFERLSRFVDVFGKKIVTSHILTETSNLLGKTAELRGVFGGFIKTADEVFIPAKKIADDYAFLVAGLTDAGILESAKNKFLIVSDDGPLLGLAAGAKIDAVSLSQLRAI